LQAAFPLTLALSRREREFVSQFRPSCDLMSIVFLFVHRITPAFAGRDLFAL